MAKRSKSKRQLTSKTLTVETLEQRQLLATIVSGSGTEVASNIDLPQGRYDQILLTGPSITVMADPNEVVRVSFLDQGGDIVQAEFAGHGTLTVSLENFKSGATVVNKNPDQFLNGEKINYVQGLASLTVTNPQIDTNVAAYAAGKLQNPGFFGDQPKQGDNNFADIARLILVGDSSNGGGYSNMGGIRMGGVVFSATSGMVGIEGEKVAVHEIVAINDVDAKGTAVPTLFFHEQSQFQSLFVRGGDLRQTNGAAMKLGGFAFFSSTDGTNSGGVFLPAVPLNESALRLSSIPRPTVTMAGDWVFDWTNPQSVVVTQNGADKSAFFGGDWLAKGGMQSSLNFAFDQRVFSGDITLKGDLASNLTLSLGSASKNITFENNLSGNLVVDGSGATVGGTLTVKGNLDGTVTVRGFQPTLNGDLPDKKQNVLNSLTVEGSTGPLADIRAEQIGNVIVRKSFSGILSTDVSRNNAWDASGSLAAGYTDVEGKIGDVSVGYDAAGKSTGGSIANGMIQGMSGIGNVMVGGDIYGASPNELLHRSIFYASSNPAAGATDLANFGASTIGTLTVLGDVDLDAESNRLIYINGNGNFGNVTVQGLTTTGTIQGLQIATKVEVVPGTDVILRILSPFTEKNLVPDVANGQKLVQNFDPDGPGGSFDDLYFVANGDVAAGAQIYDLATAKMVPAKIGDHIPVLNNGQPVLDAAGNVTYVKNTALFQARTQNTPIYGASTTGFISGNRGNLDGNFNNFGRIEITGILGAKDAVTGKIAWTDAVDMNFGGITVNSAAGAAAAAGTAATVGQITINSTTGALADLIVSGVMGSKNSGIAGTNGGTATVALTGLNVTGFEDVRFAGLPGDVGSNNIIHATEIKSGISVTTVVGSGVGSKAVTPSVIFDSRIQIDNATSDAAQNSLLVITTGMTNSTIGFNSGSGIVADDSGTAGTGGALGPISLAADTVYFDGALSGRAIGVVTLAGGAGASASGTAVRFEGAITAGSITSITASALEGNVVFAPSSIQGVAAKGAPAGTIAKASIGPIALNTSGTNNGGDLTFGVTGPSLPVYQANFGDITLNAGHKLTLSAGGVISDNAGNITLNFVTTGNTGNVNANATIGSINSAITIQGNAGNITLLTSAAVPDKTENYNGAPLDLVRVGSITATQTVWGTRGVTRLETAGQTADGNPALLEFPTGGNTFNKVLPTGSISATLNYAGASSAVGDALVARTGAGNITLNYNILGVDDNADGVIAPAEIGHGGNVSVSSISGDLVFTAGTQLTDFTTASTLGNVALKTGAFAQPNGALSPAQKGDITLSFIDLPEIPATGGFEGAVGNISATTTAGNILFGTSRFDGKVGDVTLKAGAVEHTAGTIAGNIDTESGVIFNGGQGTVKVTAIDVGTISTSFTVNGPHTGTNNGFEISSQFGAITATIGAGAYDANNDGKLAEAEFGRTGDIVFTSAGGNQFLTFNSNRYVTGVEKSFLGNITATTAAFIDVRAGTTDIIGSGKSPLGSAISGAAGNITLFGANSQVGAAGNITATTTTGTITQLGMWGDVGAVTLKTSTHADVDSNASSSSEPPLVLASGKIVLGFEAFQVVPRGGDVDPNPDSPLTPDVVENFRAHIPLEIKGQHGLATYEVKDAGTISGSVYYGGAATSADSLKADAERGFISLAVWLQDSDRDANGTVANNEFGTFGTSKLATTSGGDITLVLGTDANNAAVLALNAIPQFSFGAVTATTTEGYASVSDTAVDILNDGGVGNITITGAGADAGKATGYGTTTTNRGVVESITATTVRGTLTLNGNFGSLGDQMLTTGRYLDVTDPTRTDVYVGLINYSPAIWGTHGMATLRTDDSGSKGAGSRIFNGSGTVSFDPTSADSTFASVSGTAVFGGALGSGKTIGVDAKTGRTDIDLDIIARGYDVNGDGKISDGVNAPGSMEFGNTGALVLETTQGGDVDLSLGISTTDGSQVGSTIGDVLIIANDDVITAVENAADQVIDIATVKVTGISALSLNAGTVGNLTIGVGAGNALLTGTFANLGSMAINTGVYTDVSGPGGGAVVQLVGNIQLGTGKSGTHANADFTGQTTLNIAGSYKDSTMTVIETGTITGEVFVAGAAGKNWNLISNLGLIDVGFVAGFDADNSDGDNNGGTGAESGGFGSISATSVSGNVTLGVGARTGGSVIGTVTAKTGDTISVTAAAADTIVSGNVSLAYLSGTGLAQTGLGTVGNLIASTKTGNISLAGTFGGLAGTDFTTDAYVDSDTTSAVSEEAAVIKAGDITVNANIWGTHGPLKFTTVDSSKLAAGKSALPGTLTDIGSISGALAFSGESSNAAGVTAKSDRGNIVLAITAGIDEDAGNDLDATDAGAAGNISFTSLDGDLSLNLNIRNAPSSIGGVTLTTGSTWQVRADAPDIEISGGDIEIKSNNLGANNQNYGSVGNIEAKTAGGGITFTGNYETLGKVTMSTGRFVDEDSAIGGGEFPVTLNAGKGISAIVVVRGTHDTFTLSTIDDTRPGAPASQPASIVADLTLFGSLAAGSTKTLVATAQQGAIFGQVKTGPYLMILDDAAGVAADDATTNGDDRIGKAGDVELASLYNDVDMTFSTSAPVAQIAPTDLIRTPAIGNVTASAGSSYAPVGGGVDTLVQKGDVLITNASMGSIGSITATTTTGDIQLDGSASNVIGAINLTAGKYVDADTQAVITNGAGFIVHSTDYRAQLAVAAVPGVSPATLATGVTGSTITLTAGGSLASGGLAAGTITDTGDWTSRWLDDGDNLIETGEILPVTFGAVSMTVTDGEIRFLRQANGLLNSRSYGVRLDSVLLTSNGLSTVASSGNISFNGGGFFSQISNILASAATGDVIFGGNYEAPMISNIQLKSNHGNGSIPVGHITFSGSLNLSLVNAINSRTADVSMSGILLEADNGNVSLSGNIGENIDYRSGFIALPAGIATDNRIASVSNVTLIAGNSALDDTTNDGNVLVSGRIGGSDITLVDGIVMTVPSVGGDKITLSNAAGTPNIEGWNIGTVTNTGLTSFIGSSANIKADDSLTTRTLNGSVVYLNPTTFAPVTSSVTTPGLGSVLNSIGQLKFNGSVVGNSTANLKIGTQAEIVASKIGSIIVAATVDPTSSVLYSVTDLDIAAIPMTGEFIASNTAAKVLSGYQTIDAFSIGTITITHNLQGSSVGTAIFSGNNSMIAGGALGTLTISSENKGGIQAPLFLPGANGSAWFVVGDINGGVGTANTEAAYGLKTTNGITLVALPAAKLAVGSVKLNVGSSYTPPAAQIPDIGNAGGGTGGGFAVAVGVDVNAAGNFFSSTGAPAVAINSTGTRILTGTIGTIDIGNDALRPDNDTIGGAPLPAGAPGVIVVAGESTSFPEIGDVLNETTPGGLVPMSDGQFFTIGDPTGNGDVDANDVLVYVL